MSDVILIALVALGLAALTVRRPAIAAVVIAVQTLLVGAGALGAAPGRSTEFLVAALLLMGRAIVVSAIALLAVARVREDRPHDDVHGPLVRLCGALALLLAVTALVPPFGLDSATATRTARRRWSGSPWRWCCCDGRPSLRCWRSSSSTTASRSPQSRPPEPCRWRWSSAWRSTWCC